MRWNRVPKLLLPLAVLGARCAVAAFAADDAKPDDKAAITMPGAATCGVLSGDHFYTVADGELVDVDLNSGRQQSSPSATLRTPS